MSFSLDDMSGTDSSYKRRAQELDLGIGACICSFIVP